MPKKLCKLGLECPHMHQAQHMSEFRHEDEKAKAAIKVRPRDYANGSLLECGMAE